tara:strand:- start:235 stop:582 length:348 start_codon:yes stop_codon:yes gene_type:complete
MSETTIPTEIIAELTEQRDAARCQRDTALVAQRESLLALEVCDAVSMAYSALGGDTDIDRIDELAADAKSTALLAWNAHANTQAHLRIAAGLTVAFENALDAATAANQSAPVVTN